MSLKLQKRLMKRLKFLLDKIVLSVTKILTAQPLIIGVILPNSISAKNVGTGKIRQKTPLRDSNILTILFISISKEIKVC